MTQMVCLFASSSPTNMKMKKGGMRGNDLAQRRGRRRWMNRRAYRFLGIKLCQWALEPGFALSTTNQ